LGSIVNCNAANCALYNGIDCCCYIVCIAITSIRHTFVCLSVHIVLCGCIISWLYGASGCMVPVLCQLWLLSVSLRFSFPQAAFEAELQQLRTSYDEIVSSFRDLQACLSFVPFVVVKGTACGRHRIHTWFSQHAVRPLRRRWRRSCSSFRPPMMKLFPSTGACSHACHLYRS
jgi:hypothetical protein